MGLTLSAADAVLKEDYHGPVVDQLNNANVMLAMTEKNTEDIVGRRFITPVHIKRNAGVGSRAENAVLPVAGNQAYVDIIGPVRSMYCGIELTGQVIASMSKSRGAFIRGIESEQEGGLNDGKRDYCRQTWGESNGRLATCGVTAASTTVVLSAATRDDQLGAIEEGFRVDIGTLANPTSVASAREVVSVDSTAKTFVISGAAVTTAATDFVFRSGAGGASNNSGNPNDGQQEITGIQTMVDDTAILHTVNPATFPQWKSRVNANGGVDRAISENIVNAEIMKTEKKSGKIIDLLVSNDGVFRSYANLLASLKRVMDDVELPGGYSGVSVSTAQAGRKGGKKLALTWDRDCPNKRLYGLATGDFVFYELQDWDWLDTGGAILAQKVDANGKYDAFVASLFKYGEFGLRRRNSQFVIKDIAEA